MADIFPRLVFKQLRTIPTMYAIHSVGGRVKHSGAGISFLFRPTTAAISEVPIDEREAPLYFTTRSSDYQDISVQATLTYCVDNPAEVARRMDFSINPHTGQWRASPLERMHTMLTELAQQPAADYISGLTLTEVLVAHTPLRGHITEALHIDERLQSLGIRIVSVRVVALKPEPEMERALQTPAREQIQMDADRATYERRAVAVERERAIEENELATKITLAKKREQLVKQDGANARKQAEEKVAAEKIAAAGAAERDKLASETRAAARRLAGEADAAAKRAEFAAAESVSPQVLHALGVLELAKDPPKMENLTITPDIVTRFLTQNGSRSAA